MHNEHNEKLLSTPQVAERLSVSKQTLITWRVIGHPGLPYVKLNRAVRYRKSDVDAFLESQTVGDVEHVPSEQAEGESR